MSRHSSSLSLYKLPASGGGEGIGGAEARLEGMCVQLMNALEGLKEVQADMSSAQQRMAGQQASIEAAQGRMGEQLEVIAKKLEALERRPPP